MSEASTLIELTHPKAGITILWLNRPHIHNAFDPQLISAITSTIHKQARDAKTRVLIIAGRGPSFCSGADLNYMKSMVNFSLDENVEDARKLAAMLQALHSFPKPLISAVHGNVYAGALGLVASTDIVFAAEDTKFCISEVRLGLVPAVIAPYVIARIGPHYARRYFLSAEVFDAYAAKEARLVHECVPSDALMDSAIAMAERMLHNGPHALATTKTLMRELLGVADKSVMTQYTCEIISRVRTGAEAQAGLQAFFDKRSAPWVPDEGDKAS